MHQARTPLLLALAVVLLPALCGCSTEGGSASRLLGLGPDTSFVQAKAVLAEQGFALDGRDPRAFLMAPEDFQTWLPLLADAPALASLRSDLAALAAADPAYQRRESLHLNTYLFRRAQDDAEIALLYSAFDGRLLEYYCFLPDITPLLQALRASQTVLGPYVTGQGEDAFSLWYCQPPSQSLVIDAGTDPALDPSGGAMALFTANIENFYNNLRPQRP